MSLQSTDPESILRLDGAKYWLPSEDEWYKAAYYNPITGVYYNYATGTDDTPIAELPPGGANSANYNYYFVGTVTNVGAYTGSASPYGTYDQSGNVWEWNEDLIGSNRVLRGGTWDSGWGNMIASTSFSSDPTYESYGGGFRLAYDENGWSSGNDVDVIPEPRKDGAKVPSLDRRLRVEALCLHRRPPLCAV